MARAPKKPAEDEVDNRPFWRVNEKSFIGHTLVEEGAEIFYEPEEDGHVDDNLSPLNEAAQEIVDTQKEPHPDKSDGKKAKNARRAADAAAAGVGGTDGEGTGEFA